MRIHELSSNGAELLITWDDGHPSRYDSLWLRDNCPQDRNSRNGQRLVDIADLPDDPVIGEASESAGLIRIRWEGEERAAEFEWSWLRRHCNCDLHRETARPPATWVSADAGRLCWMDYGEIAADPF